MKTVIYYVAPTLEIRQAKRKKLMELCKDEGLEIVGEHWDTTRLKPWKNRLGLINAAATTADVFLVYSARELFARLDYCTLFQCLIEQKGFSFLDFTQDETDPKSKPIRQMFEWQQRFRKEIKNAKTRTWGSSLTLVSLPYGLQHDENNPTLSKISPEETDVIQAICGRFMGGESLRGIARSLNDLGRKNRSGNDWHHFQIRRILKREGLI
jgi:hypothetical protein